MRAAKHDGEDDLIAHLRGILHIFDFQARTYWHALNRISKNDCYDIRHSSYARISNPRVNTLEIISANNWNTVAYSQFLIVFAWLSWDVNK